MRHATLIILLTMLLAACGRPEFGTSSEAGDVVETDVDRAGADEDLTAGGGGANNASPPTDGDEVDPAPNTPTGGAQNAGSDNFAFLAYSAATSYGRNALVAPHGLARSLVVAYAAGDVDTAAAAAAALDPYLGADIYNQFNAQDLRLEGQENADFNMLASVWIQDTTAIESEFVNDLARYLGLQLRLVDFISSPEDARNQINNWYSAETGGRISEVLGARTLDANTRFVIADATWLQTSWGFGGFDPARTMYGTFQGTESNVQLPMMHTEASVLHFGDDQLEGVLLPLENGLSMLAVLPADFDAFEAALDPEFLSRLADQAQQTQVQLSMPRLEVSDRVTLSSVAEALGAAALFSADAQYDAFADGTKLDDAFQRTRVSFDELGIEVGAAADPDDDGSPSPVAPPEEMTEVTFDRPFFFAIRDDASGRYLFLGRVSQP